MIGYRPALDGLRAVAVTAVILYHLAVPGLPGGFLGVDLFFVLSGYLITDLLLAAEQRHGYLDLVQFWCRRARRLLPALLVMLAVVAVAIHQWEPATVWPGRRSELLAALFYVANWRTVLTGQSYFDASGGPSPLVHLWSLAIEEQFYLVWPLVLLAALRWNRRWWTMLVGLGVATAASAGVMVLVFSPGEVTRAYAGTDARAQQLLAGAALALLVRHLGRPRTRRWAGLARWVGLAVAAATVALMLTMSGDGGFYYRGGATVVALVFAGLIWSVEADPGSRLARSLSWPPLRWIGQISYGLYLWHIPAIRFLPGLVAVPATLALAAASYYLIERPVRRGRRLRLALGAPHRLAAAATAAIVACAGVIWGSTTVATGPQAEQLAAATAAGTVDGICPDTTSLCHRLAARPGRPTIAVVGDSVARSLDPGFFELARQSGWGYILAAHNGCGLTGLTNIDGQAPKPFMIACARQTPDRLRRLITEDRPDLVISLSRWELIAHLGADGTVVAPLSVPWRHDVDQGLSAFAGTITDSGAALAMIEVLPLAPASSACITDPGPADCAAHPDPLTAATNDIYRQVRAATPRVTVVSMRDVLCPADQCRSMMDGRLVRYDGQHFTAAGARWFVGQLAPRLPVGGPVR